MRLSPGNDLNLGQLAGRNATLAFPRTMRDKHLYVCGTTGMGKTKFLEYLIRQDIKNWHKSKCGLILLDPHGSLYDNLIQWLAWNERELNVPIIPIDLRQDVFGVWLGVFAMRTVVPSERVESLIARLGRFSGFGLQPLSQVVHEPSFATRVAGRIYRFFVELNHSLRVSEAAVFLGMTGRR